MSGIRQHTQMARFFAVAIVIGATSMMTQDAEGQGLFRRLRERRADQAESTQQPARATQPRQQTPIYPTPRTSAPQPRATAVAQTAGRQTTEPGAARVRGGKMGVRIRDIGSSQVVVTSVDPNSAAQRAGIRLGDRVVSIDGRPVTNTAELIRSVSSHAPGESISVQLVRSNRRYTSRVTLSGDPPAKTRSPNDRKQLVDGKAKPASLRRVGKLKPEQLPPPAADTPPARDEPAKNAETMLVSPSAVPIEAALGDEALGDDALEFGDDEPINRYLFEPKAGAKKRSPDPLSDSPPASKPD